MNGEQEKVPGLNKIAVGYVSLGKVAVKIICSERVWGLQNRGDFKSFV